MRRVLQGGCSRDTRRGSASFSGVYSKTSKEYCFRICSHASVPVGYHSCKPDLFSDETESKTLHVPSPLK